MNSYGLLSLLPIFVVLLAAFLTRKTEFALFMGTLVGAVLLYGKSFPLGWLDSLYAVIRSDLWIWLLLVCGLCGSFVSLLQKSGGTGGFAAFVVKGCSSRKKTGLLTWCMSIAVFVDDWLSIMTVGNAMRYASRRQGISPQLLAFSCCSASSCFCSLVPISTWGVFMAGQLVSVGMCSASESMVAYLRLLPTLFFPILMLIFSLLYLTGLLPCFGVRRRPEQTVSQEAETDALPSGSLSDFLLPMLVVVGVSAVLREILYGLLAALVFCALWYLPRKKLAPAVFLDTILGGMKDMVAVLTLITFAFVLRDMNDALGMPEYMLGVLRGNINVALFPAIVFVVVSVIGFVAGNFWGVTAIVFPAVIPVASAMGGDLTLTASAVVSGILASCCTCFYGAEGTLASSAAGIENTDYFKISLPLSAIPYGIALGLYLLFGLVR